MLHLDNYSFSSIIVISSSNYPRKARAPYNKINKNSVITEFKNNPVIGWVLVALDAKVGQRTDKNKKFAAAGTLVRSCPSHGWRVLRAAGFAYFCLNKSEARGRRM
jgi:hypothetical protein